MNRRYKILEEPKFGGFGNATLCKDMHLERDVIVKRINDPSDLDRLLNEIEALQKVRSKHVVQAYDVVETKNGDFALVEEFLPGEDLHTIEIDDESFLLKILFQLSSGLSDIHECNIVHRDLTPANIKFDSEGILKIFDFGLSKHQVLPDTTTGIIGTHGYMAPELFSDPPTIDKETDVYAFGCICFYLITGKPPKCALKKPLPGPLHAYDSISKYVNFPERITSMIDLCLDLNPDKRPKPKEIETKIKNQLLFGKHKATIVMNNQKYLLDEVNKGVKISRYEKDSIVIIYNGYNFLVKEVIGDVYVNNYKIPDGYIFNGSSVIMIGHPSNRGSRKFATLDISHPEVVL